MLVDKKDGGQVFIPEEHMMIARYLERLETRVWSRFGAVAVIVACLGYWYGGS